MSEHTKGPWTVLGGSGGMVYTVGSPYGKGAMHVADARGWGHLTGRGACAMDDGRAARIQDANALLISAAPDLLDCLKRAMPFVEAVYRKHGRQTLENGGDALEEFAAAIAKAEAK